MTLKNTPLNLIFLLVLVLLIELWALKAQSICRPKYGCDLALASYYVADDDEEATNLTHISHLFSLQIPQILKFNPNLQKNPNSPNDSIPVPPRTRVRVPFTCDCLNEDFLGHTFAYTARHGDTYRRIAQRFFANLTTEDWVGRMNLLVPTDLPDGVRINVTVNCSCGDGHVSRDYGLFLTYPIRNGEGLAEVAAENGVPAEVIRRYNVESNFSAGLVYVPAKGL
ncbi:lysM domain receptor-like kinase 3 [Senna tora]|uniref:LysM domain receptor-like kinase 3 n=1 Tax=Senna tora TaxID=362788 RepID=A0A834XA71_9FABA|nr:lysM domain receptor-like kinase 3 [Senna tora]